jgi:hypothetical protein
MIEDIDPDRIYTVSEAAKQVPSARKGGFLHPTTLSKAIKKGVRFKGDDVRHYLVARMTLGGYVIKGRDLVRFLNDYAAAYGGSFYDPSDASDVSAAPAARPRQIARAAGAATAAASTALVRGRRPKGGSR